MLFNNELRASRAENDGEFRIEGQVQLETALTLPSDLKLMAYAFSSRGQLLGTSELNRKGGFNLAIDLGQPTDVELVIGPVEDPQTIRQASVYRQAFSAKDWIRDGRAFRLNPNLFVATNVWSLWRPKQICISGHVRKTHTEGGQTETCPVPYVKVEIFDVDRESCWWPYINRWWDTLLDRPVIRIPDILKERLTLPKPLPGPAPDLGGTVGRAIDKPLSRPIEVTSPRTRATSQLYAAAVLATSPTLHEDGTSTDLSGMPPTQALLSRVGEARLLPVNIAPRLESLTLTSRLAPWLIFPLCFYSKQLVCETTTDHNGSFHCCFQWWPFHIRKGRLRFDSRPDIIIKVTQTINGVEQVLYMDPYTSTRWDVTTAHIDLYLDDEDIQCGGGGNPDRPTGTQAFFTRIGDDEVYQINQANGLYEVPPLTNVAYGGSLLIYGQFGDNLSDGTPARYYRLSYAKQGSSDFTPLTPALSDTRVNKASLFSESYPLGPKTVNGVPALYEVRNQANYFWYNPDLLGTWYSWLAEADTNLYVLRLEVFDQNGVKLTSAQVDYRDGTVQPGNVLPPMTDRCDLVITLDNKAPVLDLDIPAVLNDCGVVPWSPSLTLNFNVKVAQENNRLRQWNLQYTKGILPGVNGLDGAVSNNGLPGSVTQVVSGSPLLSGLTTTCAFALKLWAQPHIRDGRSFIYYQEQLKAIAIEKCPPCEHPPVQ